MITEGKIKIKGLIKGPKLTSFACITSIFLLLVPFVVIPDTVNATAGAPYNPYAQTSSANAFQTHCTNIGKVESDTNNPTPIDSSDGVAVEVQLVNQGDGSQLSGRAMMVNVKDDSNNLWCSFAYDETSKTPIPINPATPGQVDEQTAKAVTEALPAGTYTINAYQNMDASEWSWSDFYNWATNSIFGTNVKTGAITVTVAANSVMNPTDPAATPLVITENGVSIDTTKDYPIKIEMTEGTQGGAVADIIKDATGWLLDAVNYMISGSISLINSLLNWTQIESIRNNVSVAWTNLRDISISFLVLILMIIAFANALQIKIDQYGLGRMIPRIILAIIMAYFSWLIVLFFFDLASALQSEAASLVGGSVSWSTLVPANTVVEGFSSIGLMLLAVIIIVMLAIVLVILLFTLLIRVVVLSFLIAISPIAFIANILPFTERYYKLWWSNFFKWLFVGPAVVLILALGAVLAGANPAKITEQTLATPGASFLSLLMLAAAIFFAATVPLKLGGGIMKGWSNVGKRVGSFTSVSPGRQYQRGKMYVSGRQEAIKHQDKVLADRLRSKVAQKGFFGRFAAGENKEQARSAEEALVKERTGELASFSRAEKINAFHKTGDDYTRRAIMRDMSSSGSLDMLFADPNDIDNVTGGWKSDISAGDRAIKSKDAREKAAAALAGLQGGDQTIQKNVMDSQAEIAYLAGNLDNNPNVSDSAKAYGKSLQQAANAQQKGLAGNQKRAAYITDLTEDDVKTKLSVKDIEQGVGSRSNQKIRDALRDRYTHMSEEQQRAYRDSGGDIYNVPLPTA